jgi:PAS domain S-box-containing protein
VASGIIAVSADGLITTINPEAEHAFGSTKEDLVGYNIRMIEGIDALWDKMEGSMRSGKPVIRGEVDIQNKNNDIVPIGFNITPFSEPGKPTSGCVVIFKDLSDIRKLEEKLKLAERLGYLGKMASWIAHEIRNPLTSIDGFAQLLQNGSKKQNADIYIAEIRKGTQRINHIIDDVLTFARAKKVEYVSVDMRKLIESIVVGAKVNVVIEGDESPLIKGEEESVRRLFVNLISNSIESMEDNGMIMIKFGCENSLVTITIKDNGKGITSKDMKNLFVPFFTTKSRGTGLGLAIVKKIVDEHNGRITIESTSGKGTTCTVYLPKYDTDRKNGNDKYNDRDTGTGI